MKSVEPREMAEAAEKLSSALNRELDYVAPTLNFKEDFEVARRIEDGFREGRIARSALEQNFK
jgi:hypothetical protein